MKELSLNSLDIAQNSVKAGAAHIDISLIEQGNIRALTIEDDGCGMPPEMVRTVTDPFTTTRTTRPVGMGIPLLKLPAEPSASPRGRAKTTAPACLPAARSTTSTACPWAILR